MKKVSKRHLSVVISLIKEKKSCEKLEKEKKDFDPIIAMPGNRSLVECRDPDPIVQLQVRPRLFEAETESGQVSLYTEEASFL